MQADLVGGLTVAVMAVPQSVSFAAMAGLPAAYGLYTAFIPVLTYALFGSSRHLVSHLGPIFLRLSSINFFFACVLLDVWPI